MATRTTRFTKKNISSPDEVRRFPKGQLDLLSIGDRSVGRFVIEPGWRWSTSVGPLTGEASCQVEHVHYILRGHMRWRMDDGKEFDAGPGDVVAVGPGHDAWLLGDEPGEAIDLLGAQAFAQPAPRGAAKPGAVSLLPEGVAGATPVPPPAVGQRPAEVLQRFVAVVNGGRLEDLGQVLHADVVDHDPMPGQAPGLAGFREAIGQLDAAFPGGKLLVEESFEAGDRVAHAMVFEGPHRGAFLGMAPTGRTVRLRGTGIFRVADGKVVESWGGPDLASLMAQLGALPGGTR